MTRHEFIIDNDINLLHYKGYDVVPCCCEFDRSCPGWELKRIADLPAVFIWLDDMRPIPPTEWTGAGPAPTVVALKTVQAVQQAFSECRVIGMSLDHDLGACQECLDKMTEIYKAWAGPYANTSDPANVWLQATGGEEMPNCEHVGTGYDLVKWMAQHGLWPAQKPSVHSANPVGAANMQATIDRYFGTRRYSED